jgi:thioredoxin 1
MRFLRENLLAFSAISLLAFVAAMSLGRPTDLNTGPATPSAGYLAPEETEGEEPMSTFAETQSQVVYADQGNFDGLVLNSDVPVLVDFYADWCSPCRMVAPVLDELARETPGARIVKVDVDQNPQLASRYDISSIPSLVVFRNGRVVGEHVGVASKAHLKSLLGR